MPADRPVIGVLNTTPEVIELVEELLESEGYLVVTAIISDFRRGRANLVEWMNRHQPNILIYDLPPPYREQLNFLAIVHDMQVMQGRRFIYTTTNKEALEREEGGKLGAHEIVGKPYDLDALLKAVDREVKAWRTSK
jgi:CheY-like chemotaxis protein